MCSKHIKQPYDPENPSPWLSVEHRKTIYPAQFGRELLPDAVVNKPRPIENSYGVVIVMDNYDLSNLPLLGHCTDSGEHHPWLTDEENRRATFSRRPVTVIKSEQAERQQILSTGDEQISQQRALADLGISLSPSIFDSLLAEEPEDPFAALAAYRPLPFDDDSQPPPDSELSPGFGLLKGFTAEYVTDPAAEDLTDFVMAKPKESDVLELSVQPEPPEQSQGESEKGIVVPESANPDTVSGKWGASEPRELITRGIPKPSIEHSIEMHFQKSLSGSERLTKTRRKLDSTDTVLPLPRGTATTSHSAAMPEKSADSQKNKRQKPDKSLKERIKKETAKWVVRLEPSVERRFVCSYPNCGSTYTSMTRLKRHIFKHTGISLYKCTYPECSNKPYFRDSRELFKHVQVHHESAKFYFCTFCNKRFRHLNNFKVHVFQTHKTAELADSQKNTEQRPEESLKERVKKETAKWVLRLERGVERRYVCNYPDCGSAYTSLSHLNVHIFKHIGISVHKCIYPECSNKPYFRDSIALFRHVEAHHRSDRFSFCPLCNKRYESLYSCKRHMLDVHKLAL